MDLFLVSLVSWQFYVTITDQFSDNLFLAYVGCVVHQLIIISGLLFKTGLGFHIMNDYIVQLKLIDCDRSNFISELKI